MSNTHKFTSHRSAAVITKMTRFFMAHKDVTVPQLRRCTGLSDTTVGIYVKYLIEIGQIHCSAPALRLSDGSWLAAVYTAGQAEEPEHDGKVDLQRVVIQAKEYPLNHVRDLLHCYLFGFPDVLKTT